MLYNIKKKNRSMLNNIKNVIKNDLTLYGKLKG